MTYKMAVSRSGYNVLTDTNLDNFTFISDYGTLKYYVSSNLSITIVGDGSYKTSETTVHHGLGYVPFFIAYCNDFVNSNSINKYAIVPYNNSTIIITRTALAWADNNYLYFRLINKSSSTYTVTFYYKIFKNNLNL
jgi:hypothetical protein